MKAERNDVEDEPPAKRRLSSAVVKVNLCWESNAFLLLDWKKWVFNFIGKLRSMVKMLLVRMKKWLLMAMEPRF